MHLELPSFKRVHCGYVLYVILTIIFDIFYDVFSVKKVVSTYVTLS